MKKDSKTRLFEVMGRLDKTFKPKLNEDVDMQVGTQTDEDNEGASSKAKLEEIVKMSKKAYKKLPEGDVPAWVQDKITIAKEHLSGICNWLHTKEEDEEGEELGADREMDDEEEHEDEEVETPEKEEEEDEEVETPEKEEEEDEEESKPKVPIKNW
jgi:hypothetical protein